jgi:hypothetical protein
MAIQFINIFQFNFTQIGILGLKTNHLATLAQTAEVFNSTQKTTFLKFFGHRKFGRQGPSWLADSAGAVRERVLPRNIGRA